MKKLLILILIGLLVILSIYIAINGFEVGKIEVLSYRGIQQRDNELNEKIQQSSKLVEKDFKQAINGVEESIKQLEQAKDEYDEVALVSEQGDIQVANHVDRYEVEALWVKLGNYATSEGAVLRMDIVKGTGNDQYHLKFAVNGSYISVTDFISDIENDSTLGFKIEEFKMVPSGSDVQATFVCKDISIKEVSETSNPNVGTGNTTNTINTTNTTNHTNTSNTTNTNVAQ